MTDVKLKMILEALSSLGADGKSAFIWWVVLDKGLPVIGWLLTFAGVCMIARWIIRAITTFSRIEELREVVGVSEYSSKNKNHSETIGRAIELLRR